MDRHAVLPALFIASLAATACSSTNTSEPDPSLAGRAAGGAVDTGGASSDGGLPGSGGTVGGGGSKASAGAPSSGGGNSAGSAGTIAGGPGTSAGGAGGAGGAGATPTAGSAPGGSSGGGGPPSTDPGTKGDGDFEVGPTYKTSPDLTPKAGAPAGFSTKCTLTSSQSKIYNGSDFNPPLSFSRTIEVFVPGQYVDGAEAPFMVSSDGFYGGLRTVVQNLAEDPSPEHRVPPLVIIGIQNGPNDSPSERNLEYDDVSDRYWRFVTQEVLPAVIANGPVRAKFPNFKLTKDPNGRGGYGCSSGGPAVMGLAWFGDFNRVFSFSGSFTALHPNATHPNGAWEYPDMIAAAPLRPDLRVFLHVGENDNGSTRPATDTRNWVSANRRMAAALKAKGNHYRFVFAKGSGHCGAPPEARSQIMPEGLIWLWRGYQPK
jgi:iron(III)-enterobactin esterase